MSEEGPREVGAAPQLARPDFWRRLGCSAVDGAIVLVLAIVASVYLLGFTPPESDVAGEYAPANTEFVAAAIVGFLYCFGFVAVFGWTPGKRLGRCRVVRLDGAQPGVGRAFLRALVFPGVFALVELPRAMHPQSDPHWLSDLGALYLLATCFALFADRRRNRAIHDIAAGTRVVYEPAPLPDAAPPPAGTGQAGV